MGEKLKRRDCSTSPENGVRRKSGYSCKTETSRAFEAGCCLSPSKSCRWAGPGNAGTPDDQQIISVGLNWVRSFPGTSRKRRSIRACLQLPLETIPCHPTHKYNNDQCDSIASYWYTVYTMIPRHYVRAPAIAVRLAHICLSDQSRQLRARQTIG
jgi:hypothetical protein